MKAGSLDRKPLTTENTESTEKNHIRTASVCSVSSVVNPLISPWNGRLTTVVSARWLMSLCGGSEPCF
jgi:hypothetical protein